MSNEITYESMRRSVGGTAAAADPITRILVSPVLPPDVKAQLSDTALRSRIASRCNELLRQVRAKIGRHRTKYDTDEARAAVVLEFVLRTGLPDGGRNSSIKAMTVKAVPLGVLAAQVGVRKEYAEDTQRAIGHYLNDAAEVVGGRRENKRSGSTHYNADACAGFGISSSGGTSRHRNAGNESNVAMATARGIVIRSLQQPEIIRDLSISLGSMVEDTDGSARRGEALFESLGQHIMSNSTHKSNQQALLSDLQRNKAAYEAACFYLSVNDAEGAGSGLAKKKSNTTKAGAGDGTQSDEEEERVLSISDLMDAAKLGNKKDFEEIVRGVAKIAAEIRMQRAADIEKDRKQQREWEDLRSSAASSSMKNGAKRAKKRQREDSKRGERSGQILPQDILVAAEEKQWSNDVSNTRSGANSASKHSARSLPAFVPSAAFLEWKEQTLNEAIAKAKEATDNEKLTKQEALEWAVKDMLSQK